MFLMFPAALAFAGAMDLFTMTIPNRISLGLVIAFVVALPFSGLDAAALASHVGAGVLMLALGFLMFNRGWLGGGDAKLLASASLWLGLDLLLTYVAVVTVAGALLVLALLFFRTICLPPQLSLQPWAARLHRQGGDVPYGLAIAAGALWIYPQTIWFATWAV